MLSGPSAGVAAWRWGPHAATGFRRPVTASDANAPPTLTVTAHRVMHRMVSSWSAVCRSRCPI